MLKNRNDEENNSQQEEHVQQEYTHHLSLQKHKVGRYRRKSIESSELMRLIKSRPPSPKDSHYKKEVKEITHFREVRSQKNVTPMGSLNNLDNPQLSPIKHIDSISRSSSSEKNWMSSRKNTKDFTIHLEKVKSESQLSRPKERHGSYKLPFNISSEPDDVSDFERSLKLKMKDDKNERIFKSSQSKYKEDNRNKYIHVNTNLQSIYERDIRDEISPSEQNKKFRFSLNKNRSKHKKKSSKKLKKENVRLKLELKNLRKEIIKSKRLEAKKKQLKQLRLKRSITNSPLEKKNFQKPNEKSKKKKFIFYSDKGLQKQSTQYDSQ